jgi:uncharacterized protein
VTSLKRRELDAMLAWSRRPSHKPLVLRGARQVGKSTLVRGLAAATGMELIEFNLERNPEYRAAFDRHDPTVILNTLQLLSGKRPVPGRSLLFLDEVQGTPSVLAALRYFLEELPELHVVAAGSLLEFTLAESQFPMPVGRIEYFHLGPLHFEDFLLAMGEDALLHHLQSYSMQMVRERSMPAVVHHKFMQLLRLYCVVGGMPEAVASYAESGDFPEVNRILQNIVSTYRDDFNKYDRRATRPIVPQVFDQLPLLAGRKFKYAAISRDYRAADVSEALQQLCMARVASKVLHSSANGVPLGAEANHRQFKTLCMDVGLLCAANGLNLLDLGKGDLCVIHSGAVAEQFIGQHLLYQGPHYETPQLHYWAREERSSAAEVDYVISAGPMVVPVEVKAGTTGTLKSLHQFLKEKKRHLGVRFNGDLPSLTSSRLSLTDGTPLEFELLSLPLYCVGQLPRMLGEITQGSAQ